MPYEIDSMRQLKDLRKAAEDFRVAMIQSGATSHVRQNLYMEQLRELERALNGVNYIREPVSPQHTSPPLT